MMDLCARPRGCSWWFNRFQIDPLAIQDLDRGHLPDLTV